MSNTGFALGGFLDEFSLPERRLRKQRRITEVRPKIALLQKPITDSVWGGTELEDHLRDVSRREKALVKLGRVSEEDYKIGKCQNCGRPVPSPKPCAKAICGRIHNADGLVISHLNSDGNEDRGKDMVTFILNARSDELQGLAVWCATCNTQKMREDRVTQQKRRQKDEYEAFMRESQNRKDS